MTSGQQYFLPQFSLTPVGALWLTYSFLFHPQAWEDTYGKWDQATKQILSFPKNKADDGQVRL